MTEFEMAYLLTDMQAAISTGSSELITLVSGFLVAGYVVAHRLSRWMIAVVLGVYGYWFFTSAFILTRQMISLFGLVQEIHGFAASGKGLQWHSAAGALPSQWILSGGGLVLTQLALLAVFVASIAFFFHCRRVNRKAEAEVVHAKI